MSDQSLSVDASPSSPNRASRWLGLAVFAACLTILLPTTGDLGLTWDEPSYRYSQVLSEHWWHRLVQARSWDQIEPLLEPDALLYYWPYGRYGINFHPPLAGQLNLLTYEILGGFWQDYPARRAASVLEFGLTIALLVVFLSNRYGRAVGLVAGTALLVMPRLHGDAHIAGTDMPGLLLWVAAALAFWNGLQPGGGRWRLLVGILLGLAFVEKMAAVLVLLPLVGWLALTRAGTLLKSGPDRRGDWLDGSLTLGLMLVPLGLSYLEIRRLANLLPPPAQTNLFVHKAVAQYPSWILAIPLGLWLARRLLARVSPRSSWLRTERPALETLAAILAFAPVVAWFGNPAWWRETLPRLAHYYALNDNRRGALPDIQILYFNQIYEYSLPWANAWVLIGITVPASLLVASALGLIRAMFARELRRDPLPMFFLLNLATLPALRMLATPGHDGVRLFLPSFAFLAAFVGWGAVGLADGLARLSRGRPRWPRLIVSGLVVGPAAVQLVAIHPYELSYYNELIGGPRGAWRSGFELSYWFDPFNDETLRAINARLPENAEVDFTNEMSQPPTFLALQEVGKLRSDLKLGWRSGDRFPFKWLLTQDSKADPASRLMFAMTPWFTVAPPRLQGCRVASVIDPAAVSRAYALQWMLDTRGRARPKLVAPLPSWLKSAAPLLARFWGEGLTLAVPLNINEKLLAWAGSDPDGFLAGVAAFRRGGLDATDPQARRLIDLLPDFANRRFWWNLLLKARPEALDEAAAIILKRPDALRTVLLRYPYTDAASFGGPLDQELLQDQSNPG